MFSGFRDDWSRALAQEDVVQIEKLVSMYADEKNCEGQTALMLAAQQPFSNLGSLLLPYSLHVFDPRGRTALHYAVEAKNTNFLQLFLIKTWLKRDEDGMSPIETAIIHGNIEPLKFFLRHRMLLQDDLEAARILASEYESKEIIDLLTRYNPSSFPSALDPQKGEDKVSTRFNSPDMKALITQVKGAISNSIANVDDLICELLEKASGTPPLGKALTLIYSKRVKDLKSSISNNEQTIKRLTEDVDSGVTTLSAFADEIQRLTLEVEEKKRYKVETADFSVLVTQESNGACIQTGDIDVDKATGSAIEMTTEPNMKPGVDAEDKGTQCISLQCAECLRNKLTLDNYIMDVEDLKEKLRAATAEIDEYTAKLQQVTRERDDALDKLNSMIAETVKSGIDKCVDTLGVERAAIDGHVADLIKEIQHTVVTLQNGGSENPDIAERVAESTMKTADELIRMVNTMLTTDNTCYTQSIIESLFSNLTVFLVELLKEKHIARVAILEKIYLENAIQELHLTAHLDSKAILSRCGKSLDVPTYTPAHNMNEAIPPKDSQDTVTAPEVEPVVPIEPDVHVSRIDYEDLDILDDAEALGRSLSTKDLDVIDSPSKYTASFVKSAIREASSISSFTSDKLAELPQRIDDKGQSASSDASSNTFSSISFVSHDSNNSVNSAPGGTRHLLVYGGKRSNVEAIVSQMVKIGAEKPIVSGKPLPLSVHNSSNIEPLPSQHSEPNTEHVDTLPSENTKKFFGKRNAELNKSTSYLMKSSYHPPIIPEGRSVLKSTIASISNSWIRNSSPLNKYNADMMKKSNPYEVYGTLLSKSRSISTPLAKSQGPDVTD